MGSREPIGSTQTTADAEDEDSGMGRKSLTTRVVASTAMALVVASMLAILYVAIGV